MRQFGGINDIIFGCNSMREENEAYTRLNAIFNSLHGFFRKK